MDPVFNLLMVFVGSSLEERWTVSNESDGVLHGWLELKMVVKDKNFKYIYFCIKIFKDRRK